MACKETSTPLYCAAIDFGTTYTGLVFAPWGTTHYVEYTWEHGGPQALDLKAPTVVLFDANRRFIAFGFDAIKTYSLMSEKQRMDCYYFERFKMDLHHKEIITEVSSILTTNNPENRSMPAVKVISAAMKYLKEKAFTMFENSGFTAQESDVRWVVTVPAIWRSSARQLMRKAAYEAQLCDQKNPHGLIIALEPESAALHVHDYLSSEGLEKSFKNLSINSATKSIYDKYLILDCGGGTVDVCVHQVLHGEDSFTVRECYKATGGAWGGIYVDLEFEKYLEALFSATFINKFKKNLLPWHEIMRDFEFWKRKVEAVEKEEDDDSGDSDDDDEEFLSTDFAPIGIPHVFIRECEKHHKKDFEVIIKESKVKGVKMNMNHDKLQIKGKQMRKFLLSQINKIVQHIKDLKKTSSCSGINAIFLVGGFSECALFQQRMRKEFNTKKCSVVIPFGPKMAIVKGSIKYGFDPMIISQRIAAFTYGIRESRNFQYGDNPAYKFTTSDGDVKCSNIFKEVLHQLAPITKRNCLQNFIYCPVEKSQQEMTIGFYTTDREYTKYTTEPGMKQVALLTISLPGYGKDRKVEVTLNFSGTEIFASAKNLQTQETVHVSIDFLSKQC